jgi:hypothetical protein
VRVCDYVVPMIEGKTCERKYMTRFAARRFSLHHAFSEKASRFALTSGERRCADLEGWGEGSVASPVRAIRSVGRFGLAWLCSETSRESSHEHFDAATLEKVQGEP